MLVALSQRLLDFVSTTIGSGVVFGMAVVCAVQYAYHLHRVRVAREVETKLREAMDGLESELTDVRKDRSLTQLENSILREFVTQTEIHRALDLLLKRFVPDPESGFGALLLREPDGVLRTCRSRGLSDESNARLRIDDDLFAEVRRRGWAELSGHELHSATLLETLAKRDRDKVCELALVSVGDGDELIGVLVVTSLYPAGSPRPQQFELARRLMTSVAVNVRRSRLLEQQESRLRQTTEQLELRSIAEAKHETPLQMIGRFLAALVERTGLDRSALYLRTASDGHEPRALVRTGGAAGDRHEALWQQFEDTLGADVRGDAPRLLDEAALGALGIDRLMRTALVVPLVHDGEVHGTMCLSSRTARDPGPDRIGLAAWAASYLDARIHQALRQAVAERQAMQDGLTELANRRAFDQRLRRELEDARTTGAATALMMFDVDRFKSVNDRYGHLAGDVVLRETARIVREQAEGLRAGDGVLAARYGGEEIAVVLRDVPLAGVRRIAERIREAVEAEVIRHEEHDIRVTISAGVAACSGGESTPAQLVAAADAALYRAKQTGRNRVVAAGDPVAPAMPGHAASAASVPVSTT